MIKDTIQAVKEAEQKAAKLAADARETGRKQVEEAKAEAERLTAAALAKGKEADMKLESELAEKGSVYLDEAMKAVETETAQLKENAAGRTSEITDAVIQSLF